MRAFTIHAVVFALPLTAVLAQPPLHPGQRVRVTAAAYGLEKRIATFAAMRADTLVLTADTTMSCPVSAVTRLEVSTGRRGHFWMGFAVA